MGIVITRYEDTVNNNIVFDSSKFDFTYDGDPFPPDAATDLDNILLENGDVFGVIRPDDSTDSMGRVYDSDESQFRIYAILMDISKKDRQVHDMGLVVAGNRVMYLKPIYPIVSAGVATDYVVKEGDIFVDRNSYRWRVIKIVSEPYIEQQQIYKKAIVRNIGLVGSP